MSYASRDLDQVVRIVSELEREGITVWRDQDRILGGGNYGPEIIEGIEQSGLLLLMCSAASMRSRNVKQEIQLAWHFERPYLPLLLDDSIIRGYPRQVQYWLEGCQWVDVLEKPVDMWLPRVVHGIKRLIDNKYSAIPQPGVVETPTRFEEGLAGLVQLASFTDQIWPVPAEAVMRGLTRSTMRGLGAPQPNAQHGFALGSRVRLEIENERDGHLLLLDSGPEGITYCLCPSAFAPDTKLQSGRHVLPQPDSDYDSFLVTGVPGREQLLAIVTEEPLGLDWLPNDRAEPARVLKGADISELMSRLTELDANRWEALSTFFDIT